MKTCTCSKHYTPEEWKKLELVGLQDDGDGNHNIELRNCPHCGSTIAIEHDVRGAGKSSPTA